MQKVKIRMNSSAMVFFKIINDMVLINEFKNNLQVIKEGVHLNPITPWFIGIRLNTSIYAVVLMM